MYESAATVARDPGLAPTSIPLKEWFREGLRAGVFLPPRVAGHAPGPSQLVAILLVAVALEIGIGRLEVAGAAEFSLRNWLAPWWGIAASVLLVWVLLQRLPWQPGRPAGVSTWFALWMMAAVPPSLLSQALSAAQAYGRIPAALLESPTFAWSVYLTLWAWTVGVALRMGHAFGLRRDQLVALGCGLVAIFGVSAWQFPDRPWSALQGPAPEQASFSLRQETFEAQQAAWQTATESLSFQRPGVVDVYGLVFAPYAGEDVFLRESTLVADVLAQRFEAQARVLHLVNHATTSATHPWATPLNLRRAIEALAARMDRQEDVLVVYLTSHGASNFQLAADHAPLQVEPVSPTELRTALDEAGIRHRVVAVSACFSGGWVGPLASDTTLVMTAADAEHTSYGCGKLSELTFFGRAVFGEQLRKTRSFEQAFAAAVPVIKRREEEAGKPDGFSNPQISVGAGIRPVLQQLERRLEAAARP